MLSEAELVLEVVAAIFDRLGIAYMVGGSVASGIHGVYRYTNDIDFVADIPEEKVTALAATLNGFYADEEMILDAVETNSSFSIIHLEWMIKVDVFIKAHDGWTDELWRRRQLIPVSVDGTLKAYLPSPEDAILQKLRWFEMGGGVSDRQWSDILGMLRVQEDRLDSDYLRKWARRLSLSEYLDNAIGRSNQV